ncbi:zinc-binding metallopeptidase family protein [Ulvibacterium sp.]|uniref:zinc-binding metallopeptidase family protein n=1 Tax=Ulvibacterium sp. TaxID=2665914 RepID=UPI003BA865F1
MKLFNCPNCSQQIFFENLSCLNCGESLVFYLEKSDFVPTPLRNNVQYCRNRELIGCNWLSKNPDGLCQSCALTHHKPKPGNLLNITRLTELEAAKRRLAYQLKSLKLPIEKKDKDSGEGIQFNFLPKNNKYGLLTGHSNGVITLLLSEADSVQREQMRKKMSEPYRTILGHLRHEIGHYYWKLLCTEKNLDSFRRLFGDERIDYSEALNKYHENGAILSWNETFISKYASAHPWEDWAETFAHYLHIMDTLETAHSFGISINPRKSPGLVQCPNPYQELEFQQIFKASVALTGAVNSLNRSMGISDIYPFVVPYKVYEKLQFVHQLILSHSEKAI